MMLCNECRGKPIVRGLKQITCYDCSKQVFVNYSFESQICEDCSNKSSRCICCGCLIGDSKTTKEKNMQIKVKYHNKDIEKIKQIPIGDWIDLRAAETIEMKQFEYKIIPLGISMELPEGLEANIVPRSGTFKNWGILQTNSFGVIDNSFCGDNDKWGFPALAMRDTIINEGDRICQFRLNHTMRSQFQTARFIEVETLGNDDRGGWGSTGRN